MGIHRVKFCADVYSAGNPQPHRVDIENLLHSDFSIDTFYPLLLESWENIIKWLVKTIWRENFGVNYDSQQTIPKRPPQNTKLYLPATLVGLKRSLNISGLCIFLYTESNDGVYCTLSIEVKELEPIRRKPGSRDMSLTLIRPGFWGPL